MTTSFFHTIINPQRGEISMLDLQVEIFILVGIGYLISKLGLFNKQTRKQVTDLVLNIVLPVATAKSFLIKLTPSIMKTTLVVF